MPARSSEAYVLRTYPYKEGDLIVSFFTRDQGKLRGAAKRARRLKSPYGSALERLSRVRLAYYQRENAELVRIDGAELIESQFALSASYEAGVALDYIAEVSEQLLPPAEPNERFYRLLNAVLTDLRASAGEGLPAALWRAVTYFTFWAVRLSGFLPELKGGGTDQQLARAMAVTPVEALAELDWTRATGLELRRALQKEIESHIERRLATVALLEAL
ncbi:MAG: DNA repair protein RecO [Acidobacteriota bacterium]